MLPFKRVVFPVDYSDSCKAVAPYAKEMVNRFSAALTVVHAYGAEGLALSELTLADPKLPEAVREAEEARLRQFAAETFAGLHVETFVALGEAGSVVNELIHRQGADLVMLATHGRGPLRRLLLGSVTAKILHDATTPVWTVSGTVLQEHAPKLPYASVLAAVDGTDEAEAVLKASAALASAYQARLFLAHVVETLPASVEIDFAAYKKELMDVADVRLRELKGELGIDAPHVVLDGMVADGVRQEAIRRGAGMIVTGRGRAQGAVSRLWSHLYQIVREAPCPVLSI